MPKVEDAQAYQKTPRTLSYLHRQKKAKHFKLPHPLSSLPFYSEKRGSGRGSPTMCPP